MHIPKFNKKRFEIFYFPHGFYSMSDLLKKKGYKVQILHLGNEVSADPNFSLKKYIVQTNAKVIAVSLQWHYQIYHTIRALKLIKRLNPDCYVVLGGFTASYFHEQLVRQYPFIDGVIRGDGEMPIYKLAEEIRNGNRDLHRVPNLTWRGSNGEPILNDLTYVVDQKEINKFNYTNLELIKNYNNYLDIVAAAECYCYDPISQPKFKRAIVLPLGRGCSVDCAFCGGSRTSQKLLFGRDHVVFRSVDNVINDIKEFYHKYNIKRFHFCFDPFPKNPAYFCRLFRKLREEKLKISADFETWGNPSQLFIDEFKSAFLPDSVISLSPETGSDTFRKKIKGHFSTNEQFYKTLDYLEKHKIYSIVYFIKDMLGQSRSLKVLTKNMIKTIKKKYKYVKHAFRFNILLEPASPMYLNPRKYNIKVCKRDINYYYKLHSSPSKVFDKLIAE